MNTYANSTIISFMRPIIISFMSSTSIDEMRLASLKWTCTKGCLQISLHRTTVVKYSLDGICKPGKFWVCTLSRWTESQSSGRSRSDVLSSQQLRYARSSYIAPLSSIGLMSSTTPSSVVLLRNSKDRRLLWGEVKDGMNAWLRLNRNLLGTARGVPVALREFHYIESVYTEIYTWCLYMMYRIVYREYL